MVLKLRGCVGYRRNPFAWEECVRAIVEHINGEFSEDGKGLLVEVSHHGVTVPASHEFDNIRITAGRKKSHSAPGSKRSGAEGARLDAGE